MIFEINWKQKNERVLEIQAQPHLNKIPELGAQDYNFYKGLFTAPDLIEFLKEEKETEGFEVAKIKGHHKVKNEYLLPLLLGKNCRDIAKEIGVSMGAVAIYRKELGITRIPKPPKIPRGKLIDHLEEIRSLRISGMKVKDLAQKYKVGGSTLAAFLQQHKILIQLKKKDIKGLRSLLQSQVESNRETI